MRKALVALLLLLLLPNSAYAVSKAKCQTKVCVKVFTDPKTGQVIIQAYQNRPGATKKPKVLSTPLPKPTRTWKPRPYVYRPYTPRPKVSSKPKVVSAISLSDQLTQLIPMREIYYQPAGKVLAQVPVNFWTTTNNVFTTAVVILGVGVSVNLTPTYTWDFGDGATLSTTNHGAPYPNGAVLHTYRKSGDITASLTVSWAGTWMADTLSYPVLGGAIVQRMSVIIPVAPAPTKYTR
ncbi:MAG: PKD domain-containing protein [Actinobacteria bacterium]|jgi:hypothetical protein|nr:PKD domain-containing protein [Actinomycetota bacterium]